jgi:hypothetical protein
MHLALRGLTTASGSGPRSKCGQSRRQKPSHDMREAIKVRSIPGLWKKMIVVFYFTLFIALIYFYYFLLSAL